MHDQPENNPDLLESLGYERRDVAVRLLPPAAVWFTAITLAMVLVAYLFVRAVDADMTARPKATDIERRRVPQEPYPLLQSNATAVADMNRLKQEETAKVSSYGWVDQQNGKVRVPVDVAADIFLKEQATNQESAQ